MVGVDVLIVGAEDAADHHRLPGEECGAEDEWYEEMEKKFKNVDEDVKNELKRRPRNGPIPDIHELAYVRGFRDYPQVLTGGVINPWAATSSYRAAP